MGDNDERSNPPPSRQWFERLLANISDTVSIADADGVVRYTSGMGRNLLGFGDDYWHGANPFDLIHPDDKERAGAGWLRSIEQPHIEISEEVRMRSASGAWQDVAVSGVNLLDDPEVEGFVITTRNVTPLRQAQRLATHQADVLEVIARGAPLADVADACVALLEANGVQGRASIYLRDGDRMELRSGRAPESLAAWMRVPTRRPNRSLCDQAMATGTPVVVADLTTVDLPEGLRAIAEAEGIAAAWSQPVVPITSGQPVGSISILYPEIHEPTDHERQVADIACSLIAVALERVENETRLAHQALHDGLTGLPNRTLLLDRLDHALERRATVGADMALLFCDIDRFKVINDSLGHNVGDQLLVAFAERFRSVIAPGDTVARFGGDEFVVLLEDVTTDDHPLQVAEALAESLARPFLLPAGKEVYLTVSIGLAVATDHRSGDAWLRDADAAMYRAKDRGRNRLAEFDTDMRDAAMARLQVEHDLRRAVDRGELVVHYQPIIDLQSGRIVGAEALVRWEHPERGLLAPGEFISVAEDIGTIGDLGAHVLAVAVSSMAPLVDPATRPFQLSVNVSARQLNAGGLEHVVHDVCDRFGWPGSALTLEITESALVHGLSEPFDTMAKLKDLGVSLAIDDFGTGYSSLARLGHLPVDQVKIDRSFVAAIDEPDDRLVRIVDAVIAIAGALDQRTTAEGVESQAQLDYLRRSHCGFAQGYLFAKPLPLEEFAELLAADPRW